METTDDGRSQTSMKSKVSRNRGAVAESGNESTTRGYSTTSKKSTKGIQNRRGHSSKKREKCQRGSKVQNTIVAAPPPAPPKNKKKFKTSAKDNEKCLLFACIIQVFLVMVYFALAIVLYFFVPTALFCGFIGLACLQIILCYGVYASAGSKSFNLLKDKLIFCFHF